MEKWARTSGLFSRAHSVPSLTNRGGYVKKIRPKEGAPVVAKRAGCAGLSRRRPARMHFSYNGETRIWAARIVATGVGVLSLALPVVVLATHEADHRFTVEGYVCGSDGNGVAGIEVLIKDTRISYGQVVKTNGDGYYTATFHLHNDNLGDPLLVEAQGERQNHKIQFDPKDLESERKTKINFGSGCDSSSPPTMFWIGIGTVAVVLGGAVGMRIARSQRKRDGIRGKSHGKRKS